MFPSVKTRFSAAARRGLDLAVEFATLGEYRLPESAHGIAGDRLTALAGTPEAPGDGSSRRRSASSQWAGGVAKGAVPARPRARRIAPASAAGRRLQPSAAPLRISSHSG